MRANRWLVIGPFVLALAALVWLILNAGLNVYAVEEPITARPSDCSDSSRLAVIGDYGDAGEPAADVATLVDSWGVDYIVTLGDNNYPDGEAESIDENVGQYYQSYIHPYLGEYGPGSAENRFYPALGNHDWKTGSIQAYLDYFTLPGNERYYALEKGPLHLFILDSDRHEPDGRTQDSVQARWLEEELAGAGSPWRLLFLHHPPYASSLQRGGDEEMQWPFASWGADVVLAGHDHLYERLEQDGIPYIVNGLGGRNTGLNTIHRFFVPKPGSLVRYNKDYGAMLITASDSCLNLSFYARTGDLIDSVTLLKEENI